MRTTLTLDADVAATLKRVQAKAGLTLKEAVNEAMRRGLGAMEGPEAKSLPTGLPPHLSEDASSEAWTMWPKPWPWLKGRISGDPRGCEPSHLCPGQRIFPNTKQLGTGLTGS